MCYLGCPSFLLLFLLSLLPRFLFIYIYFLTDILSYLGCQNNTVLQITHL